MKHAALLTTCALVATTVVTNSVTLAEGKKGSSKQRNADSPYDRNTGDSHQHVYDHAANDYDAEAYNPSFYDRKATNEKSSDYANEKKRDDARSSSSSSSSDALIYGTREEKIMILEDDLHKLRQSELAMALQRTTNAEAALRTAKANLGWFPSKEDKDRIVLLESTTQRHRTALANVQAEERALELRLKPLYGIVSKQFWDEQRRAISGSIDTVHKMAADQAWWNTIFSVGQADSLQELLMNAVGQYVIASIVFYFLGCLYFAFWTSPWTVYEYSSSLVDVVPGVVSYLLAVLLMLIPLLCFLGVGAGLLYYGVRNLRAAGEREGQGQEGYRPPNAGIDAAARERVRREEERARHQQAQQERYAPPRNQAGGFGGPIDGVD